jgi:hypothetical protein
MSARWDGGRERAVGEVLMVLQGADTERRDVNQGGTP